MINVCRLCTTLHALGIFPKVRDSYGLPVAIVATVMTRASRLFPFGVAFGTSATVDSEARTSTRGTDVRGHTPIRE